ncbi:hypothetical protein [Parabacteroides sp. AF19-14]|uniref:hypothetical protein n=1 Tax=Parabacteroides sp. AF19-14 TaxID=2293114 RepID=UPI001F26EC9C|nr:hypothetical protein [Parabacteroides sp. AF19-14]
MTYIELINNFWELDEDWQFTCCETRLYFYLLKTVNRLGWVDSWTRSDAKVSSDVGVSVNSMKTARNRLVQAGLIEFKSGGNGQRDKTRYIVRCQNLIPKLQPKHEPNLIPNREPKPQPYINKTKIKTKNINIPPTPPKGVDKAKEKELLEKEEALRVLEEELKKREAELGAQSDNPPSKPKKRPNPLNSEARKLFEERYQALFSSNYYWSAKDAGNMSSLLKKLKFQREKKNLPIDDQGVLNALKYLLDSITDGWILENFSVTNINSKFNEIVSQIMARKQEHGNTKHTDGAKAREQQTDREIMEYARSAFRKDVFGDS